MAHDNIEDLMMEAERLGIREDVFEKVGKMKKKSKKHPSDLYDEAFTKVKKKLDKKRRTAK
jgi:3-methyladenine DNA glycosylase AlkD